MRAIALTLENLRAINRYGACNGNQQYEGFKGLPPGEEQDRYFIDAEEAAEHLARLVGSQSGASILEDKSYYEYCYKKAAKIAHPDSGGSDKEFQTLQQARDLIELFFQNGQQEVA